MTQQKDDRPATDRPEQPLREPAPNVIDQRQQQIDPAGRHRIDPDARAANSTKQPGRHDRNPD